MTKTKTNIGNYHDKNGEPRKGKWIMVKYNYEPLEPGDYYRHYLKGWIMEMTESGLVERKVAQED